MSIFRAHVLCMRWTAWKCETFFAKWKIIPFLIQCSRGANILRILEMKLDGILDWELHYHLWFISHSFSRRLFLAESIKRPVWFDRMKLTWMHYELNQWQSWPFFQTHALLKLYQYFLCMHEIKLGVPAEMWRWTYKGTKDTSKLCVPVHCALFTILRSYLRNPGVFALSRIPPFAVTIDGMAHRCLENWWKFSVWHEMARRDR